MSNKKLISLAVRRANLIQWVKKEMYKYYIDSKGDASVYADRIIKRVLEDEHESSIKIKFLTK